jgi:trehalose 6-phosphate phosphatase
MLLWPDGRSGRLIAAQNDLESFLQSVAQAPRSALLLDYDGTLAPFRVDRDEAHPYTGVASVLQAIVNSGRTRVFIVTGRKTDDIVSLLGIYPYPEIWGLHGIQRRMTHGAVEMACVDEIVVQALMEADRWLQTQNLRQTAEFKPGSIAVHWRGLDKDKAADVRRRVLQGWTRISERSGAQLLEFDGGIELRPPEPDKGDAVRDILGQFTSDAPVAYLGDDKTDEQAFRVLEGRGLRVLVRPEWRETAADIWLKPPEELLDFLNRWLNASQPKAAAQQPI